MNKYIVSLIAGLSLVLGTSNLKAQATISAATVLNVAWGTNGIPITTDAASPGVAAVGTNLFDGGALVSSITLYNPTVAAIDVGFIDAPATNGNTIRGATFWSNSGPTTVTFQYLTNISYSLTNFSGLVTNLTKSNVLWSGTTSLTNQRAAFRRAYFVTVPPNTTVTPNLGNGLLVGSGLTVTNGFTASMASSASNVVVTVTYNPSL